MRRSGRTSRIAQDAATRLNIEGFAVAYDHIDYEHTHNSAELLAKKIRDIFYRDYDPDQNYHLSFHTISMSLTLDKQIYLVNIQKVHYEDGQLLMPQTDQLK